MYAGKLLQMTSTACENQHLAKSVICLVASDLSAFGQQQQQQTITHIVDLCKSTKVKSCRQSLH